MSSLKLPLALVGAIGAAFAVANCGDDDDAISVTPDGGTGNEASTAGKDGPPEAATNPNVHDGSGNATNGQNVFRFETFGNEGFWTKAAKLPAGIVAKKLTPVQALQAGLSVNVDKLDDATKAAVAAEIAAHPNNDGPLLNDFATTVKLINANAVIGVVAVDSDANGTIDIAAGNDMVGVSCALCHAITDKSVLNVPTGGSVGKAIDGPAAHTINIGAIFAMAANTRAFFPMARLKQADGTSIGRAPADNGGLTKDSLEADFDAYFSDQANYPTGMFDDTVDGFGNPMHNTPLFEGNLGAPWGSSGEFSKLDQFANTVYTGLLDLTTLTTPGGKATLTKIAGAAGSKLSDDYTAMLAADGVTGFPFVKTTAGTPGAPDSFFGAAVDHQKLLDLNAYINGLKSPAGTTTDPASVARGRETFRSDAAGCTNCHNVDQSKFVPPLIVDMKTIFPGDNPTVLATRDAPASPVENTPNATFDDKMIVINASLRGLNRGAAMPLLMDLARKPVFLHDNSVPSLDNLLDSTRGATAAHPFYVTDATQRADVVAFLKSLDDTSK